MGKLKILKLIFWKFKGQFELEGQGHLFFKIIGDLKMINTHLKLEAKIPNGSKVVAFPRNYTKLLSFKVTSFKPI